MLLTLAAAALAQEPVEYIVQVEVLDTEDGLVTLSFDDDEPMRKTAIYRRAPSIGQSWRDGELMVTLEAGETTWTDPEAQPGDVWEYDVERYPADGSPTRAQGMVMAALDAPLVDDRGLVLLVVDTTIAAPLTAEIDRLRADLVGDGYVVHRVDVARDLPVPDVKAALLAAADGAAGEVTVLLLGHVPVPYAGSINPDGHPDHFGAWPADLYYAELDDVWTDNRVNTTVASREANRNVPGDGKFDASTHDSDVDWMIGRVDMFDLPAFGGLDEVALLRRYLDKDHAWRHGEVTGVAPRALVDDNFGSYAPAAKSAWALAPLVGRDNVVAADWLTTLATTPHLWAFGSGGGTYTSASGVASTPDFAANPVNAVFTLIFGSYHGDWDTTDNLMRAAIAADGLSLTAAWAGRPNWFHHPLGAGETTGYAARWSQNNEETADYAARWVHVALLGDPTLRMSPVAPPADVVAEADDFGVVTATWTPSPAADLLGYHVYVAASAEGPFTRVTDAPVVEPTATWQAEEGAFTVMVRAVQRTTGFSGTYENPSQGAFGAVDVVCAYEDCAGPPDTDTEDPGGCACDASGSSGAWGWAALGLGLVRRRRRASPPPAAGR